MILLVQMMSKIVIKFEESINRDILPKESYIDSTLHHLIITPYLLDSTYLDMLENKNLLKTIIKNFSFILNKIWCNDSNDKFKKEDPLTIIRAWSELIYKINNEMKIENKNKLLIEV